ncbi:MAG: MBL fold metallo-hydrolase [Desulfobacterales bacterium]|nr:MAG: MBL fold metallo-hydrolase [Desulfobacterales bacterium]
MTHTHWDHVLGIPFFLPLLSHDCRLIAQDRTFDGLDTRGVFGQVMKSPFFPVRLEDYPAQIQFDSSLTGSFSIGSIHIDTIPTSHSKDSLGYKFTENERSFVFITDNELGFAHAQSRHIEDYIAFCDSASLLFHDAEYTDEEYNGKQGWGHSSLSQVLDLAVSAGVGQLGLIHINQNRTDDEMDQMVKQGQQFFEAKQLSTACFGVSCDFEIIL